MKRICLLFILLMAFQAISFAQNRDVVEEKEWPNLKELDTARDMNYMSEREKDMIREINMVRAHPRRYLTYITEYIDNLKTRMADAGQFGGGGFYEEEIETAYELYLELQEMENAPILKPHRNLYKAARLHGEDERRMGDSDHVGSDGSYPWDRITKHAPDLSFGNENLVGGPESVRQAVILLLVDSGIPGRGHRRTMLDYNWQYVACFEVGKLGDMPNNWVQNYGRASDEAISASASASIAETSMKEIKPEEPEFTDRTARLSSATPRSFSEKKKEPELIAFDAVPTRSESQGLKRDVNTRSLTFSENARVASPVNAPPDSTIHIVTQGETLYGISRKYGVSVDEIRALNRLSGSTIFTGQQLLINVPEASPQTSAPQTVDPALTERVDELEVYADYMRDREKAMIKEINRVRYNPKAYIPYVQDYLKRMEASGFFMSAGGTEEKAAARELISELQNLKQLSVLRPHRGVYDAARVHGQDMKRRGHGGHKGSDGSWPWDRVLKAAPDLSDGNENLVGGPSSVRDAVIILLIDSGIPGRGHRRTMLNPEWQFVGCYEVGTVGQMPNYWVQAFGSK